MKGTWGCGNEIIFHNHHRIENNHGDIKSSQGPTHIVKSWPDFNESERILLHGWHRIFHYFNRSRNTATDILDLVHRCSRKYLSELFGMVERIDSNDKKMKEFYGVGCIIWQLFEIFYLDPSENITKQMVEWLQRCCPDPSEDSKLILPKEDLEDSKDGKEAWERIIHMVIQGRTKEAIDFLKAMGLPDDEDKMDVIDLLSMVPSLHSELRSKVEFKQEFEDWKARVDMCKRNLSQGSSNLDIIVSVLQGDMDTLEAYSQDTFEFVVSQIVYQRPDISKEEIPELVRSCRLEPDGKTEDGESQLDNCLLAIMEGEIMVALQKCQVIFDRPWFQAHLADLLSMAGCLPQKIDKDSDQTYRNYCLVEYASSIMTHPTLWQLSLIYFTQTAERGRAHIRTLVETRPCKSARDSIKMLSLCDSYSLSSSKSALCNRLAVQALRHERFGEAINWYVRSGASQMVSRVCTCLWERLLSRKDVEADVESVSMNFPAVEKKSRKIWASLTLLDKIQTFCKLRSEVENEAKNIHEFSKRRGVETENTIKQGLKTITRRVGKAIQVALQIMSGRLGTTDLWFKILHECEQIIMCRKKCLEVSSKILPCFQTGPVLSSRDSLKLLHHLERTCAFLKIPSNNGDGQKSIRRMRITFSGNI